jgi:FkbM family methyltransferase
MSRANRLALSVAPEITCIDVGASHFLHKKWLPAFQTSRTTVVAVDPNEWNLSYLKLLRLPARLLTHARGLSAEGGPQTLYVTNVDTGSSLKRPSLSPTQNTRLGGHPYKYFFPLRESIIPTDSLEGLARMHDIRSPLFVKLDTQGSELDILIGASRLFDIGQIVMVESEASLLRETSYENATRLPELTTFMESKGFDLVDLRVVRAEAALRKSQGVLNECDAVFVMGFERAMQCGLDIRLSAFFAYLLIGQNDLAKRLLDIDSELSNYINQKLSPKQIKLVLRKFIRIN